MVVVSDLLDREDLGLVSTHVPTPETPVRWVATSELPDPTPYLEGGEVLLTTGLETRDWHHEWREYVARLAEAGVAALGLADGLTHERPPEELVAACRAAGLNLFEIPQPTTFVSVSRTAAAMLEAEREGAARQTADFQRALIRAALEVEDTSSLVGQLAVMLDGAASRVTRDGRTTDGPHGPRVDALDPEVVRAEVERIHPQGLRAAASVTVPDGTTIVRPLGIRSRPESWLAVFVPRRPTDADRTALNTAVTLLSLALERLRERRTSIRQLRARAVELVLADDVRTAQIVLGAASAATPAAPRLPGRVRILRVRGSAEHLDDTLARLEEERLLAAVLGDELVAVCEEKRAEQLGALLAERGLRVGIGRSVPATQSSASHDTAGHALAATGPTTPVRTWDDLTDAGVAGLLSPDRAAAFARSFLAPLEHDPVLRDTLDSFLRRHGSRGETAAELGVHRNTVRNRVAQIEALLGTSLDDPQTRVDAWVALRVAGQRNAD